MMLVTLQQNIWTLLSGTVIRVNEGLYDHVAMVGDQIINGERSILAFSAKSNGFIEQPYSAFARGRRVTIDGYLGNLPPEIVLQRARLKCGGTYSWVDFNCEHFVRHAHDVPIESPQLQKWAALTSVFLLSLAIARS